MKVLFIAGTGRSGSTLLNAFLGKSPSVLALGELMSSRNDLKKRLQNEICTCENNGKDCFFWQGFLDFLNKNAGIDYYESLVEYVANQYPEKRIIVDSSKDIASMLYWVRLKKNMPNLEIYTIHLVRDVRGWIYSWYKRRPNISKFNRLIWTVRKCYSWHKRNIDFDSSINKYTDHFIRIGYEEFIFYRQKTTDLIFSYCDETNLISKYNSLSDSEAHELSEFSNSIKKSDIQYDYYWMTNWLCSFLGVIYPFIFNLNKKYVYGNLGKKRRISGSENYEN